MLPPQTLLILGSDCGLPEHLQIDAEAIGALANEGEGGPFAECRIGAREGEGLDCLKAVSAARVEVTGDEGGSLLGGLGVRDVEGGNLIVVADVESPVGERGCRPGATGHRLNAAELLESFRSRLDQCQGSIVAEHVQPIAGATSEPLPKPRLDQRSLPSARLRRRKVALSKP